MLVQYAVGIWPSHQRDDTVTAGAGVDVQRAVGFLGRKNPQHAFLRRGNKAVGPMS